MALAQQQFAVSAVSSSSSSSIPTSAAGGGVGCTTPVQTSASTCNGGACCEIKQRVTLCPDYTIATATVNGAEGACCVVLKNTQTRRLVPFCATATPTTKALGSGSGSIARRFPAGVRVWLDPRCEASSPTTAAKAGAAAAASSNPAAVMACTATFPALPPGFEPLTAHSRGAVALRAGRPGPFKDPSALAPCAHASYGRLLQTLSVDKATGALTFGVTCTAS